MAEFRSKDSKQSRPSPRGPRGSPQKKQKRTEKYIGKCVCWRVHRSAAHTPVAQLILAGSWKPGTAFRSHHLRRDRQPERASRVCIKTNADRSIYRHSPIPTLTCSLITENQFCSCGVVAEVEWSPEADAGVRHTVSRSQTVTASLGLGEGGSRAKSS
jgi:hypothetical protein